MTEWLGATGPKHLVYSKHYKWMQKQKQMHMHVKYECNSCYLAEMCWTMCSERQI